MNVIMIQNEIAVLFIHKIKRGRQDSTCCLFCCQLSVMYKKKKSGVKQLDLFIPNQSSSQLN
jgi:hypothetical protein